MPPLKGLMTRITIQLIIAKQTHGVFDCEIENK